MLSIRSFFSYFKKADFILFGVVFLLVCFGVATIYGIESATQDSGFILVKRQIFFSIIGFCLLFIAGSINYKTLRSYNRLLYVLGIALLILVLIVGQTIRGTRGWFQLFGFGIQPVEVAKFAAIVWLATFFSKEARNIDLFKNIIISGLGIGVFVFFILLQPDFGSALTVIGIWFLMILIIGMRRRHLLLLISGFIGIALFCWMFLLKPYQLDRIMVFIDPARDPLGRGYNVTQATIAVGSGQLFGRGLGYGSQTQLKFLPESQTDFIFAVMAEEFGFFGIMVIVFLWGVLFWRLGRGIRLADNDFGAFLILGVSLLIFIQIMVNAGMNVGLAPVTGISLPFMSYGGSFLIMLLIMIGFVQSVIIRR